MRSEVNQESCRNVTYPAALRDSVLSWQVWLPTGNYWQLSTGFKHENTITPPTSTQEANYSDDTAHRSSLGAGRRTTV